MAGRYLAGLESLARREGPAAVSLLTDDIRVIAFDALYVPNLATDGNVPSSIVNGWVSDAAANVPAGSAPGFVATSPGLAGKTIDDGRLNANDVLFTALPGGKTITQLVVAKFYLGDPDYMLLPLALITHKTDDTPIAFPTGSGVDLIVRWENVAPFIYEV